MWPFRCLISTANRIPDAAAVNANEPRKILSHYAVRYLTGIRQGVLIATGPDGQDFYVAPKHPAGVVATNDSMSATQSNAHIRHTCRSYVVGRGFLRHILDLAACRCRGLTYQPDVICVNGKLRASRAG